MAEKDLAIRIRADLKHAQREMRKLRQEVRRVGDGGNRAKRGVRGLGQEMDRTERSARSLSGTAGSLRNILAAIGAGLAVRQLIRASDTYKQMEGQLRLVTDSSEELAEVQSELFDIAQDTRSAWEGTVNLYARVARNSDELGVSQGKLLALTKATNQAIQISGATSQEAAAGVTQFAQALAAGELRGDELRSVMEQMPRLAQAIADGLGISRGELRKFAEQGELTADRVIRALLSQTEIIDQEFGQLTRTVGQAVQQLQNQLLTVVSETDMTPLLNSLDELREVLTDPAVVEGIKTLATGAIRAISAVVKYSSEVASAAEDLGRIAALAFGDLDELTEIEAKIEQLQDALGTSEFNRTRFFGSKGVFHVWTDEEIQTEIDRLQEQRRQILEKAGRVFEKPTSQEDPESSSPEKPPQLETPDRETEKARQALESLSQKLQEQVATFGKGNAAALEYRLTVGDLSDEVERLGPEGERLAQSIVQQAQEIQRLDTAKRKEAQAERERTEAKRAAKREEQELLQARRRILDEVDPTAPLIRELELIDKLRAKWPQYADAFDEAALRIHERMDELHNKSEETNSEMGQFAIQAARNMETAFGDFFFDAMNGRFDDLAGSFKRTIDRMVSDLLASQLASFLLGDFDKTGKLGGVVGDFVTGLFHSGGVVGEGGQTRTVSPLVFAGAERYHRGGIAGLRADEVPAIMRRGEEVLTENDPRHSKNGGAGGVTVTGPLMAVYTNDAQSFRQSQGQVTADMSRALQRAARRNR